jgi:hypothetical protein
MALHRLHDTLGLVSGTRVVPRRLMLPHIPTFLPITAHMPHTTPRVRTPLPLPLQHPFLMKAAFPTLGVEYLEDWGDYCDMEMPWVFETLVIADSGAAIRAGKGGPADEANGTIIEATFKLALKGTGMGREWWDPIRAALLRRFSLPLDTPFDGTRPVVTYISRQNCSTCAKLRPADHTALIEALRGGQWETIVIDDQEGLSEKPGGIWPEEGRRWETLMKAVLRSTVRTLVPLSRSPRLIWHIYRSFSARMVHICYPARSWLHLGTLRSWSSSRMARSRERRNRSPGHWG